MAHRAIFAAALLGLACFLPSCNIVAPVMIVIEGPPTFEALYELNKERPTVILVDDNLNILPRPRLRQVMAKAAQDALLKEGVLKKVIDSNGAYAVISRDREGQVMSLIEVAKTVEAEVIISVTIDSFGISQTTNEMELECSFRVRVLDATREKDHRLWPPANVEEGAAMTARYRMPPASQIETNSQALQFQNALAEQTGLAIAQIFYEHEKSQSAASGK